MGRFEHFVQLLRSGAVVRPVKKLLSPRVKRRSDAGGDKSALFKRFDAKPFGLGRAVVTINLIESAGNAVLEQIPNALIVFDFREKLLGGNNWLANFLKRLADEFPNEYC